MNFEKNPKPGIFVCVRGGGGERRERGGSRVGGDRAGPKEKKKT